MRLRQKVVVKWYWFWVTMVEGGVVVRLVLVWFGRERFLLECGLIVVVRRRRSGCVVVLNCLVAWCSSIGEMEATNGCYESSRWGCGVEVIGS